MYSYVVDGKYNQEWNEWNETKGVFNWSYSGIRIRKSPWKVSIKVWLFRRDFWTIYTLYHTSKYLNNEV